MIYILLALVLLAASLLLLRLRLRLEVSSDRKLVFLGLGRSGPEFDFRRRQGVLRVFGLRLLRFDLDGREKQPAEKTKREKPKTKIPAKPSRPKRRRPVRDVLVVLPQCLKALGRYALGLLRAAVLEQAEGEIEAGFESPHLTGQVFGYYQAALAAVPGLMGRVLFIPDWTGQSFSGALRVTIAWPVYRLVWQTTRLVFRLPVRKIIKLAIGTKEGVQDGE